VVYIDRIECGDVLTVGSAVGNTEPIYCAATGKAILSFLDPKIIQHVIEKIEANGFIRFTENTILSTERLMEELKTVRKNGFATDNEERYPGVLCIAAAIKDYTDNVVTSIGISGPVSRMNRKKVELLSEIVLGIAKGATEHLKNVHLGLERHTTSKNATYPLQP
jgi:DNA-binding IclR family transcriptional regulator